MQKQTHVRIGSSLTLPLISSGSSTRLMRPFARWTCGTQMTNSVSSALAVQQQH